MSRYNAAEVEPRWQKQWEERDVFRAEKDSDKPRFYALEMFPYPSGKIHMGHVRNYAMGDVIARYKKANGFNVLHPMGWDAFGMPAENAAIESGGHPKDWTYNNIAQMKAPLKRLGFALDWSREFATCDEAYYKQQQAIFLKFWEKGLVYRKLSKVNWDPIENTVLANEQVIDGRGWRSGALVEQKELNQWFYKITEYADELVDELDNLKDWPEKVRSMQANWIGRSDGLQMRWEWADSTAAVNGFEDGVETFTTRPDTLFGASFIGLSADHPLTKSLAENNEELEAFRAECAKIGTSEEEIAKAPKLGFDTGLRVKHPFTGKDIPVWVANFVLMGYGTGAVFACPAHDQRDLDFARKYDLAVTAVVLPEGEDAKTYAIGNEAYTGDGKLFNSDFLNGLPKDAAIVAAIARIEELALGGSVTQFRLRDWGVSRQRYWGCPIPVIHCDSCGAVPVPEKDLPVALPYDINFDEPSNPLDRHPTFKHAPCPKCGKPARRETDTLDTFGDSSWYFARFAGGFGNGQPDDTPFDKKEASQWLPVDQYIGGIEHAVLHLLYARFFTKGLRDCGLLDLPSGEPFKGLFTQGMVTHAVYQDEDKKYIEPAFVDEKDGQLIDTQTGKKVTKGNIVKMSKSKKNVINPNDIIEGYGADVARWFVLSDSPPERDVEWTEAGVIGAWRFSKKLWALVEDLDNNIDLLSPAIEAKGDGLELRRHAHKAIDKITRGIEEFRFNTSVAQIYELTNALAKYKTLDHAKIEALSILIRAIAPFMPHLAEECWAKLGGDTLCYESPWPKADPALLVDNEITLPIQINGKRRSELKIAKDLPKDEIEALAFADENVKRSIEGKEIRKVIIVPGRIINIVAT